MVRAFFTVIHKEHKGPDKYAVPGCKPSGYGGHPSALREHASPLGYLDSDQWSSELISHTNRTSKAARHRFSGNAQMTGIISA